MLEEIFQSDLVALLLEQPDDLRHAEDVAAEVEEGGVELLGVLISLCTSGLRHVVAVGREDLLPRLSEEV